MKDKIVNFVVGIGLQCDVSPSQAIAIYDLKTMRQRYLETNIIGGKSIEFTEYRKINGQWKVVKETEAQSMEDALKAIEAFKGTDYGRE